MTRIVRKHILAAVHVAAFVLLLYPDVAQAETELAPAAAASVEIAPATEPAKADGAEASADDAIAPVEGAAVLEGGVTNPDGTVTMPDGTVLTAEEAATAIAEGPMAESEAVEVENPYGLGSLWKQGGFVARFTLLTLAIMSMGSWYILFTKALEQRGMLGEGRRLSKRIAAAGSLQAGIEKLPKSSAFRATAEDAYNAAHQHASGMDKDVILIDWVSATLMRSIDGVAARLQGGLAFLATVGSTAPFVGLFGTVWGIYQALIAIGVAGQASIDKVAGPVGEALIMTAIGLAVAVPAVLGYNWLVRRNKAALDMVRRFSNDVLVDVLTQGSGARKTGH